LRYAPALSALVMFFLASTSAWANMGASELIAAAETGNLVRVKALLATKVNVNATAHDGTTALVAASQAGNEEVVQALLDAKADVNAKTSNGTTGEGVDCRQGGCEWQKKRWHYGPDAGIAGRTSGGGADAG
jgi:uncharacterized protein